MIHLWQRIRGWIVDDFRAVHVALGLIGNLSFVVGSVFFFYDNLKVPAIWLFIVGSTGMLIGSIGNAFVMVEHRRRLDKRQ